MLLWEVELQLLFEKNEKGRDCESAVGLDCLIEKSRKAFNE